MLRCDKAKGLWAKSVALEPSVFGDQHGPDGVRTEPGGRKVTRFKAPDGDILSLSEHIR